MQPASKWCTYVCKVESLKIFSTFYDDEPKLRKMLIKRLKRAKSQMVMHVTLFHYRNSNSMGEQCVIVKESRNSRLPFV